MSTLIKTPNGWKETANLSASDVIRNPDWSRAINVSAAQLNAGYTAPEDGIIILSMAQQQEVVILINNVQVALGQQSGNTNAVQCPVAKNDVIKTNVSISNVIARLIPYKVTVKSNQLLPDGTTASITGQAALPAVGTTPINTRVTSSAAPYSGLYMITVRAEYSGTDGQPSVISINGLQTAIGWSGKFNPSVSNTYVRALTKGQTVYHDIYHSEHSVAGIAAIEGYCIIKDE